METEKNLEKLAKASGVLAVCALILSVIYDWGFFLTRNGVKSAIDSCIKSPRVNGRFDPYTKKHSVIQALTRR